MPLTWRDYVKTAYNNIKSVFHMLKENHDDDMRALLENINDNSFSGGLSVRSHSTFDDTSSILNNYFDRVHDHSANTNTTASSPMSNERMGIANESFTYDVEIAYDLPEPADGIQAFRIYFSSKENENGETTDGLALGKDDANPLPDLPSSAFTGESNRRGLLHNYHRTVVNTSGIGPRFLLAGTTHISAPEDRWETRRPQNSSDSSSDQVLVRYYKLYHPIISPPPLDLIANGELIEIPMQNGRVGVIGNNDNNVVEAERSVAQGNQQDYFIRRDDPVQFHLNAFDSPPPSPRSLAADLVFNMQGDPSGAIPNIDDYPIINNVEHAPDIDFHIDGNVDGCPLELCRAFGHFVETTPNNVKDKQAILKEIFQNIYQLVRSAALEAPANRLEEIVEISASVALINNSFGDNATMESYQGITEPAKHVIAELMTVIDELLES